MQLWKEPISPLGLFLHMIWVENIYFLKINYNCFGQLCNNSSFYVCKSLVLAYTQLMMITIDIISSNGLYCLPSFAYKNIIQISERLD